MRNFTEEKWNDCLSRKNWDKINDCSNVNEMVKIFSEYINEALDEVAPIKTFTIRSSYKFGISEKTKKLMKDRDSTRKKISQAKAQEKVILHKKYHE